MVERHDLKWAEAEVEIRLATALPAGHLSGRWLAACCLDRHQPYSHRALLMAKYNRVFLFPEMCPFLISSDAETAWRRTARQGRREGGREGGRKGERTERGVSTDAE